jgi:hypothetical protein
MRSNILIKNSTLDLIKKIISPTTSTPEVILDPEGSINLKGRLIAEDPLVFFSKIEDWIKEYFKNPAEVTNVEIQLEFINSVGSKFLLDLIHDITQIYLLNNTKKFEVRWFYEEADEDMHEKGTFFASVLKVHFNFVRIT